MGIGALELTGALERSALTPPFGSWYARMKLGC
jgi:hypothetical protein